LAPNHTKSLLILQYTYSSGVKIQASIIFLGTGQGSYVVGRNILSSGGIIIQTDENQFHIDPGPNTLKNTAQHGINLRANTALLVSHAHLNHSNDINAVIDAMTYSGFDKKGVLVANKTAIHDNEDHKAPLNPHYRDFLERFIVLEAGQRVGINEVEILALKTKHSDPSTIGFKFFTPHFTLSYSSDTKYFPELIEEYKNSNILILNVPYLTKEEAKDNLCLEDAIKIIKEVSPRLAIIQHFGIEMIKADPMYQIREIQKATGIQTIAAKDGMVINPLSYSVDHGQRTLQSFPKGKKTHITEDTSEPTNIEEPVNQKQESTSPSLVVEDIKEEKNQELKEEIKEIMEEKQTKEEKPADNLEIKDTLKEQPKEDILQSDKPLNEVLKQD